MLHEKCLSLIMDSLAHKFTYRAYDWVTVYVPRIFLALIIFLVGQWIIRMISRWTKKALTGKRVDVTLQPFLQSLFSILLQVLLVLGIMQVLGIQMTIFAALVGALGVAAGLALSGTFQNFASGVLIILLKPFKVGDNINTQGHEGTVTAIRIFYTVVLTFDNTTVIVPNSKLSNEIIFNLSRQGKRRMDVEIKFNYAINFDTVKNVALRSIDSFDKCLKDPPPRIGVQDLQSDGFIITINAWTQAHGFQDTKLAFLERLMKDIKEAGIKMPGMV
jgi:small conductance mechanosensitive channel